MSEEGWTVRDVPIGLPSIGQRVESDTLGSVRVPADRYWGAQTQRSLSSFAIGDRVMPSEVHRTYGVLKRAAAIVNARVGQLPTWKAELIARVADEVSSGVLDVHFPLRVWQSGSGTQTNMNVNEVIANRCIQLVSGQLGSKIPVHPNDDVNMSQSTNDTFVTVMHMAAHTVTSDVTVPGVRTLREALHTKAQQWDSVWKVGRTHLQDATPLTVGQEWSGYVGALDDAIENLEYANRGLLALAVGGTAVGTAVNAPPHFGSQVTDLLAQMTGQPYTVADNPFTAQGTLDRMVRAHAALKSLAVALFKIANDMRWLGSGPRAGLAEVVFPSNEPGSSIMPGKVNPSQAEALMMVCVHVMGADVAVQMAGAEGSLELNTFRPLVIATYLDSARLLGDASDSFTTHMIAGAALNERRLQQYLDDSVMLVTALAPAIGYDVAAEIAKLAVAQDLSVRQAALAKGFPAKLLDDLLSPARLNPLRPHMTQ